MILRIAVIQFTLAASALCLTITTKSDNRKFGRRENILDGAPSISSFVNRAYQSSVVLGDYLYVDGGEIAFFGNAGRFRHLPDNNTYSIDLSKSWTNSSISFNTIQKSAPVMNYVSLWPDVSRNVIYAFGGEQSGALPIEWSPEVAPTSVWKFTPNDNSGEWSEVTDVEGISGVSRPAAGIGASTADTGFLLGGYQTRRTSAETVNNTGFQPVPGLVVYDFTTNTVSNRSSHDFSTYGTAQYGQGQAIVGFGDHAVLAFFGGETSNAVAWRDNGANLLSFDTIHIYDPQEDRWYTQQTSGDTPAQRDRFCSVGLASDDGSYEIFLFGGHVASAAGEPQASNTNAQRVRNTALDEVWVLSIPSFNWQKANYTAVWPRVDHSCNIIGKRQMVVIGGLNPASADQDELLTTEDPWTNGIGIFDLTEMQWKDSYSADAAAYTSPDAVKNWYRINGRFPSQWNDPQLENYFRQTTLTNSSSTSNNTSSDPSDNSSSSSSGSNHKSNAGAIAGGVVGGLVGLALIGAAIWYFRRRKTHQTKPLSTGHDSNNTPAPRYSEAARSDQKYTYQLPHIQQDGDGGGVNHYTEYYGNGTGGGGTTGGPHTPELAGREHHPPRIQEKDGTARPAMVEVPGTNPRHEMAA